MIPPGTYEVYAAHSLSLIENQGLVEWAGDALAAGFDSRSLRILAGLESPFDFSEVERLYRSAFRELGIAPLPAGSEVRFYIGLVLRSMLEGRLARREALNRLSDLHVARDYDRELRDFYLLYHAKWDLESESVQWYWPDAGRENIDRVIDEYAVIWLKDHEEKTEA